MLSIQSVRQVSQSDWQTIWATCPYSTFFQSPEWSAIWCSLSKGKLRPNPRLVRFSDGKTALLPLTARVNKIGVRKSFQSSPAGTYGGWISHESLSEEHCRLLKSYLTNHFRQIYWRVNPIAPSVQTGFDAAFTPDETHCLDLTPGFDAVVKGWSKGHYSAARKAQREGLEIATASTTAEWDSYYDAYLDSVRRWGEDSSSAYPRELFAQISKLDSALMKLWLARFQGNIVAGALCFYAPRHVVYWHGAALEKFFPLRPVHLLMLNTIKDACERGYSWFDFNPSGANIGVAHFKSGFGAQVLSTPTFTVDRSLMYLLTPRQI